MPRRWVVLGGLAGLTLAAAAVVWAGEDEAVSAVSRSTDATSSTTAGVTTSTESATTTSTAAPGTTAPATETTTSAAPAADAYRWSIEPVSAADLGSSYRPGIGCAEPADLRAVDLVHWGDDGAVHEGRIIVAAVHADAVAAVFGDLFAARFPMTTIIPVDHFGADDQRSMRANNTSGYNCRTVAGSTKLSNHAFGAAIDVNPLVNPYVRGSSVDPPEGAPWADRSADHPGMIRADDAVVRAFTARGWSWGGYWSSPDYQHFSVSGT